MLNLVSIETDFREKLAACSKPFDLHQIKSEFLGKKSQVSLALKEIPKLNPEDRKAFATDVNRLKSLMTEELEARTLELEQQAISDKIEREKLDVTLVNSRITGSFHPVAQATHDIVQIMQNMGFVYKSNREIETLYHNFTGLNIPDNHPARAEQDTFYTTDGKLLRTHTSSVQVHVLENEAPPLRLICPGRVYRNDSDRTHSPMFHQLECMCIDENVDMSMLFYTIKQLLNAFFKEDIPIRLRPNYFPFTEPSAEVDIQFEGKWLEVLGCGMVHPNVLKMAGIDTNKYQGFAFGVGIDRLVMLRHRITDLRDLFDNHTGFLEQFFG